MIITPTMERNDEALCLPNFVQWRDLYLADCKMKLHKQTTYEHYHLALRRFGEWMQARLTDGVISRRNAKDFAYWLSNIKHRYEAHPLRQVETTNLSPVTVRRTVGVVRTFFTWLYEEGYMPRDFAIWFPFPQYKQVAKKVISITTLEALLQGAASGDMPIRDTALITLLADTELRRQELTSLLLEQIQWLDGDGRGCLNQVLGKGDRFRIVPFSPMVGLVLQAWLEERKRILHDRTSTSQFFITPDGTGLMPSSVYQVLLRCAMRAGVEDEVWNTHSLRHNFATHFWRVQRDTKSLSLILGHSSQKITEDVYVHAQAEDLLASHTSVFVTGHVTTPDMPASTVTGPTREQLRTAILANPNWRALGKQFQMSDVGVRKMAQRFGLLDLYYQDVKQAA